MGLTGVYWALGSFRTFQQIFCRQDWARQEVERRLRLACVDLCAKNGTNRYCRRLNFSSGHCYAAVVSLRTFAGGSARLAPDRGLHARRRERDATQPHTDGIVDGCGANRGAGHLASPERQRARSVDKVDGASENRMNGTDARRQVSRGSMRRRLDLTRRGSSTPTRTPSVFSELPAHSTARVQRLVVSRLAPRLTSRARVEGDCGPRSPAAGRRG